jgi:DNA-binding NtrC family response regulator
MYLPRIDTEPGIDAGTGGHESPPEEGRGRRVLVVEDNVQVGRFSTQLLQDLGYETTWAANADEALKILRDSVVRFDVVFTDVVMPGMSGLDMGREIRRLQPDLPVVLTTGYSHALAEEGPQGFEILRKPYAAEELSRILRRVSRRRSMTSEPEG